MTECIMQSTVMRVMMVIMVMPRVFALKRTA